MIALHTEMFGQSYVEKLAYAQEHGWVASIRPRTHRPRQPCFRMRDHAAAQASVTQLRFRRRRFTATFG